MLILIKIGIAILVLAAFIFCGYQLNVNCCSNFGDEEDDDGEGRE